uniref:Uncharacterized protein n=1 Tax=Trichobilharzia regenti TaxID=157069 RepID=A0AA85IYT1_TRIRE|nr:unnamed protein product [Trichobilharzia regenti]
MIICISIALECYVCNYVEGNWNDCVRTVQTCEPLQDTCQSIVQYRSKQNPSLLESQLPPFLPFLLSGEHL